MTDKLEDTSLRLKDEMDLYRKMMDKLRQNRHQFQKEKEAMQEVAPPPISIHSAVYFSSLFNTKRCGWLDLWIYGSQL